MLDWGHCALVVEALLRVEVAVSAGDVVGGRALRKLDPEISERAALDASRPSLELFVWMKQYQVPLVRQNGASSSDILSPCTVVVEGRG